MTTANELLAAGAPFMVSLETWLGMALQMLLQLLLVLLSVRLGMELQVARERLGRLSH